MFAVTFILFSKRVLSGDKTETRAATRLHVFRWQREKKDSNIEVFMENITEAKAELIHQTVNSRGQRRAEPQRPIDRKTSEPNGNESVHPSVTCLCDLCGLRVFSSAD